MWNAPTKTQLQQLPKLYTNDQNGVSLQDTVIHMHFFLAGCDWYIAEFDGEDLFWGFAVLNNDLQNAEWGYISLSELKSIEVHGLHIDRDLHWKVRPACQVDNIKKASGW